MSCLDRCAFKTLTLKFLSRQAARLWFSTGIVTSSCRAHLVHHPFPAEIQGRSPHFEPVSQGLRHLEGLPFFPHITSHSWLSLFPKMTSNCSQLYCGVQWGRGPPSLLCLSVFLPPLGASRACCRLNWLFSLWNPFHYVLTGGTWLLRHILSFFKDCKFPVGDA